MDKEHRIFSIPYNNSDPEEYLQLIEPYNNHIENIFLGISELSNHMDKFARQIKWYDLKTRKNDVDRYNNRIHKFLEITKGKYKRIITINNLVYYMEGLELLDCLDKRINPLIEKYEIDGVICTQFEMLRKLHKDFPKLELHSSCNCYQFNLQQMDYWREAGCSVFNPPREIARMPKLLKEMHDAGFKLKVLINETCMFGCPKSINHTCNVSLNLSGDPTFKCYISKPENILKTNLILPQWLDYLDEYVDIYKLSGRLTFNTHLQRIFDAYILNKPMKYVNDIRNTGQIGNLYQLSPKLERVQIPLKYIPDKLRWCEGKDCNDCKECKNALIKILEEYKKENN